MYSICMECYEIYDNRKLSQCPKSTCAGKVISVDELMIPAIITINKKGYSTSMCCSSHEFGFKLEPNMYGARKTWINFKKSLLVLPSAPEGFILRHIGSGDGDGRYSLRIERDPLTTDTTSVTNRQTHLFDGVVSLTKWAESLPKRITSDVITFQNVYDIASKLDPKDSIEIAKNIIITPKTDNDFTTIIGVELKRPKSNTFYDLVFYGDKNDAPPERVMIRFFRGEKTAATFTIEIGENIQTMKYFVKEEERGSADMVIAILTEFINK